MAVLAFLGLSHGSCGYLGRSVCFTLGSGTVALSRSMLPLIERGLTSYGVRTVSRPLPSFRHYRRNYWELSIPLWMPLCFFTTVAILLWTDARPVITRLPWFGKAVLASLVVLNSVPVVAAGALILATNLECSLIMPGLLLAGVAVRYLFRWRRPQPGHCRQCGYNLTGNVSGTCPECGTSRL